MVDNRSKKNFVISLGSDESDYLKAGGIFKSEPMNELGSFKFSCQINFLKGSVTVIKQAEIQVVQGTKFS